MSYIQFLTEAYCVTVHYEPEESIQAICKFESNRIQSLIDRGIQPKSEVREWDSIRGISVRSELCK